MTRVHDVVVVGAGAAGLSAALELATAGLDLVLLESHPRPGGAAALSGGGCCLVETSLQRERGVADDVEVAFADWLEAGGEAVDAEWARRYLTDSRELLFDWLSSLGVDWVGLRQQEGNSFARWHKPQGAGRAIVDALLGALGAAGAAPRCSARLTGVQVGDEDGLPLVQCTVSGPTETRVVRARTIVFATGGFVNNRAMLDAQGPRFRAALRGGAPQAVGDGHQLLAERGALMSGLDRIWTYPIGTPDPRDLDGDRGLAMRGQRNEIWVNRHGDRFWDETARGGATGAPALMRQPGRTAWGMMDAQGSAGLYVLGDEHYQPRDDAMVALRLAELFADSPHITQAESLEELATAVGLPVRAVCASVEQFNDAVRAGLARDPSTGRALVDAQPLERPPYVAVRYFPMAQKNLGGVVTDECCRVVSHGGHVQPGLYAAGELTGMAGGHINGSGALEGTMLGPSLYSGRLAGQAVVRDLAAAGVGRRHYRQTNERSIRT